MINGAGIISNGAYSNRNINQRENDLNKPKKASSESEEKANKYLEDIVRKKIFIFN